MKPEQFERGILRAEIRKSNRYRLNCPALFRWAASDGSFQDGQGTTRDVSRDGVFVLANRCPPAGSRIDLKICLPRLDGTGTGVRLNSEGHVLRVEHREDGEMSGFAASGSFFPYPLDEAGPSELSP